MSSARNAGLEKATGDFILFIDSDDLIDSEKLVNTVKKLKPNTDLLFSDVIPLEGDKSLESVTQDQRVELYKSISDIGKHRIPIAVTFTIYSHKLLSENNLSFDTNLRIGEDMYFNLQCISVAKNIILTSEKYYHLQEAHSTYLFKPENLDNELYFRKVTDEFFNRQNNDRVKIINQRMAIKGIIFLVYRYFVPGIFEKKLSVNESVKKLKEIGRSVEYNEYLSSSELDSHFSGREKLVRKLLGKGHYRLTIYAGMIMNKIKPEKRY